MKKKGIYLLLGVLLLLNVSLVLAAGLDTAFSVLNDTLNVPELYGKYPIVIESMIWMTLFIALGVKVAEKARWTDRAGKTVFVVLGIALGIATTLGFRRWGITLETFGLYGGLLLMLGLVWGIYKVASLIPGRTGSATQKVFFSTLGIVLGFYIANTMSNGALHDFLNDPSKPFISSIYNIAFPLVYLALLISLFIMLFSMFSGTATTGAGAQPQEPGFLNGIARGINGLSEGVGNVRNAWRNRTFFGGNQAQHAQAAGAAANQAPNIERQMRNFDDALVNLRESIHISTRNDTIHLNDYNGIVDQIDNVNRIIEGILNTQNIEHIGAQHAQGFVTMMSQFTALTVRLSQTTVV